MRVLFLPLITHGVAMGTITRCLAVADPLRRLGHEAFFLTNGAGAKHVGEAGFEFVEGVIPAAPGPPVPLNDLSDVAVFLNLASEEYLHDALAHERDAVRRFRPDVLVGSSFGAAVAVELLQTGLWRGATLLLAQAALRRGARAELPPGVPVWLVHGLRDELIDIEDSRRLALAGSPEWVVLHEVDDDHPLHETVASGRLVELVRALSDEASRKRNTAPRDASG